MRQTTDIIAIHWLRPLVILVVLLGTAGCSLTTERQALQVRTGSPSKDSDGTNNKSVTTGPLTVLSLNMAHGRKDAINQLFLSRQGIENNLRDITTLLKRAEPEIVALQEADGPSRWSGNFDHVSQLAQQANYPWHARASHATGWLFDYGTALLSRSAFTEVIGHSFRPTPPTMTKGLLLGQITWQPDKHINNQIVVDIISVHLDFSREHVRQQQINEMMQLLSERKHPVIILGDFNSDWFADDLLIEGLVKQYNLNAYKPEATNLGTYYRNDRRLDWILISDELEFKNYKVLPNIVSDHAAIIAEVMVKPTNPDSKTDC